MNIRCEKGYQHQGFICFFFFLPIFFCSVSSLPANPVSEAKQTANTEQRKFKMAAGLYNRLRSQGALWWSQAIIYSYLHRILFILFMLYFITIF